jgi:hypothetical protein
MEAVAVEPASFDGSSTEQVVGLLMTEGMDR